MRWSVPPCPVPHDLRARALPGDVEPLLVERLEQVVHCVYFKRADRILIVCGDKNDMGNLLAQRLQHFKPTHLGHLHVEKDNLGRVGLYCVQGLMSVNGFPYYFHQRVALQHFAQHFARERLIVDQQHTDRRRESHRFRTDA